MLGFIGNLSAPGTAEALVTLGNGVDVFDKVHAALFAVTNDPQDAARPEPAGCILFHDMDGEIAALHGATNSRVWLIFDPGLILRRIVPMQPDGSEAPSILQFLRQVPPPGRHLGFEVPAPVMVLPDVFEPALCDHLIGLYRQHGGQTSGFMRESGGKTVAVHDTSFKSRRDYLIEDQQLVASIRQRFLRKVVPEIARVHFFQCTRMERYVVSCYAANEGGHFRPHRDNTTPATAHRRFAVSINLNDGFEGGEVEFPEYGPRRYRAPKGGAVIFSCSILHAVSRVTKGERFAFLPFLYDEAAAKLRENSA